jgi:hypothetical protein
VTGERETVGGVGTLGRTQKILSSKNRWETSGLDFLGSRRHPPDLLSSNVPNCQRAVLLSLLVQ